MNFFNPDSSEIIEHRKTLADAAYRKPKSKKDKHREEIRIKLRDKLNEIKDYHTMHDAFI